MKKQDILSRRLQRAQNRDQAQRSITPQNGSGLAERPLSFSQERYWFTHQLDPDDLTHNRPFAWRLTGQLDYAAVKNAIESIVQRHEALRSSITAENGQPQLKVQQQSAVDIPLIDLSQQADKLDDTISQLISRPVHLDAASLFRVTLIKLDEQTHITLFVMHHSIFDGLSEQIFKQEFQALYSYHLNDSQPFLFPELPIQYSDYSHWQREQLTENRLQQLEDFWHKQLDSAPQFLTLPTDHPRPTAKTTDGRQVKINFPADIVAQLTDFSHKQNTTLFVTLLAAFYLLLHRYTQQTDILVGVPTAGRAHPQSKDLIGFFTNTVVLRGDLSADPSFTQLLQTIRKTALDSFEHQAYPVEKLFETFEVERETNVPPLFQVLFNLEQTAPTANLLNGPKLEPFDVQAISSIYDLSAELEHDGEHLTGKFIYDSALFDHTTIERLTGHYLTLLQGVLTQPDSSISKLPLLTQPEKSQLLTDWNETAADYEHTLTLSQLFERQVAQRPDQIVVTDDVQSLTYAQLNARANQLARHLVTLGVGPNKLVGLFLERSLDLLIGIVAILKAGGAYVPIDPQLPQERRELMLADAQVNVVLTEKAWYADLLPLVEHVVCVDALPSTVSLASDENFASGGCSDDLAYMIYTSGSTGTPKGTLITQRNLHNYVHGRKLAGIYTADDVMLHGSTISFDIAVEEIFCPLLLGGRIVLLNRIGFKDIDLILETIQQERVTAFTTTPSVLTQCLASTKLSDCSDLAKVILGGEALTIDLKNQWLRQTGIPLINSYGPTETTVDVTTFQCEANNRAQTVPIGRPSANTQIYILDQHLQPVPIGVHGEIMIGGDCVGRGYWNRPELTAEKFIPNPHAPGTIYRTGDLGRFLADGNIEFLGRVDHQTKIRGFRVELGEIESTILEHPNVTQTVVQALDINGSKQLVAYVAQSGLTAADLRQSISKKLPDYMVPAYVVLLDKLPLMLNGKINLRQLPQPTADHLASAKQYTPPQTQYEKQLATIWQDVLKIERIGTQDNFFDLGGHSLLVTKIISRIRSQFHIEYPMKTFFESPHLAEQAEILELMLEI